MKQWHVDGNYSVHAHRVEYTHEGGYPVKEWVFDEYVEAVLPFVAFNRAEVQDVATSLMENLQQAAQGAIDAAREDGTRLVGEYDVVIFLEDSENVLDIIKDRFAEEL